MCTVQFFKAILLKKIRLQVGVKGPPPPACLGLRDAKRISRAACPLNLYLGNNEEDMLFYLKMCTI